MWTHSQGYAYLFFWWWRTVPPTPLNSQTEASSNTSRSFDMSCNECNNGVEMLLFRVLNFILSCTSCASSNYVVVSIAKVNRVAWWMGNYGSSTPKPHYLYSNSPAALEIWNGKLKPGIRAGSKKGKKTSSRTTKRYTDKNGKPCWTGTRHLKETELLGFT